MAVATAIAADRTVRRNKTELPVIFKTILHLPTGVPPVLFWRAAKGRVVAAVV